VKIVEIPGGTDMEKSLQDLRYALRSMAQARGFTVVAILTLAIGIAANVTVFTAVNATLLRPLPYSDPERLVGINETLPKQGLDIQVSYANHLDWRKSSREMEDIGVFAANGVTMVTTDGGERVSGAEISTNLFPLLGIAPSQGRNFAPDEGGAVRANVALISDGLWHRRFGGEPNIIGTVLKIDGRPTTILGVMPPKFRFPENSDIWLPIEGRSTRGTHYLFAIGRMRSGVTIQRAQAELASIEEQIGRQFPYESGLGVHLIPLRDVYTGDTGPLLFALVGAVVFVLLIGVANVANLLLCRSNARQREMAIRVALGAGRLRIIRQLLTESAVLSAAGGAMGYLISLWVVDALVRAIPEELPFFISLDIDYRVLAFTVVVTAVTGILFGLAPALTSSNPNLNNTLKETSQRSSGGRQMLRKVLVTAEVALALTLLVGSGLMIESFLHIRRVKPGFDRNNVLAMNLWLTPSSYPDIASRAAFHRQALDRLAAIPGVETASGTSRLPLGGNGDQVGITIEEPPDAAPRDVPVATQQFVAPGYFRAMGIPLIEGRDFNEGDDAKSEPVVIIDESLARQFWPNENPIGKRLRFGGPTSRAPWDTVIGVVGDVHHYGLKGQTRVTTYTNYLQNVPAYFTYVVRTAVPPQSIGGPARDALRGLDAEQPLYDVRTMDEVVRSSYWEDGFFSDLFGIFAGIAVLLAAIGIYGIVSYAASQRVREIGIRMALGARGKDVLSLIVGHGLRPVALGIAIGNLAALGITKGLSSLFFGVDAWDPPTFIAISALLTLIAAAATYVPARRATRIDPVVALRHE
jgi:putative ABC transport system permease protein